MSGDEANFLTGLLLGDRTDLSDEIKNAFMNTGTIHVLAVSGSHVVLVAEIIFIVVGLLRFTGRTKYTLAIIFLIYYMFLTGATPSVVRATLMVILLYIGKILQERTDVYNLLGASAVIILLIEPRQLFDVGFQLSFSAVFSIVYFYPKVNGLMPKIPEAWDRFKALSTVWQLFAVSLAAQIGTSTVHRILFRESLNRFTLCESYCRPAGGDHRHCRTQRRTSWYSIDVDRFLFQRSERAALRDHAGVRPMGGESAVRRGEYGNIRSEGNHFLFGAHRDALQYRRQDRCKTDSHRFTHRANIFLMSSLLENHEKGLTVTFLDVGQGDGAVIQFPSGETVIVDAGPRSPGIDAGERTVAPFLRRLGITTLCSDHHHSSACGPFGRSSVFNEEL
jgi:competence protein ComEC